MEMKPLCILNAHATKYNFYFKKHWKEFLQ